MFSKQYIGIICLAVYIIKICTILLQHYGPDALAVSEAFFLFQMKQTRVFQLRE